MNETQIITNAEITEVVKGQLYLGGIHNLKDRDVIECCGINGIVSVSRYVPHKEYADTVRLHVPLIDGEGNALADFAMAVMSLNIMMRAMNRVVFVHCRAGVSRSPTVVAAALAIRHGTRFDQEVAKLVELRPCVEPNSALRRLAREYLGEAT